MSAATTSIPLARPVLGRGGGARGPRGAALAAALARPAGAGVRAGVRRAARRRRTRSAVSSGTAGLHLALRAVGVDRRRRGRHVAVLVRRLRQRRSCYERARPVFADIDPVHAQPRPARRRPPRSPSARRALLPVHIFGYPADMPAFEAPRACRSSRTPARRSAPSTPTARRSAARGHPAVFGFYANKQLTTGEGGMVTIGDAAVKERDRLRAQPGPRARHGLARPRPPRLQLPPERRRLRDRAGAARAARRACSPARARVAGALPRGARRASRGSTLPCADAGGDRARLVRLRRPAARDGVDRDDDRRARCASAASRASPTCRRST